MPALTTKRDGVNIIEVAQQGLPGPSAYDLWIAEGNTGDEQDFLDSLEGEPGLDAPQNTVLSDPTGITGADAVTNMVSLTQAEYDALPSKSATTFYVIVG